ncbi:copper transporter [Desmospora profundinema]|nr:copper transporter [Desmospora profundinema]
MRYHTITLVAVFLALTMGILLGGSSGGAWFEKSRQGMVQTVLDRYQETRQLNKKLEQELAAHKKRLHMQQEESLRVFQEAVRHRLDRRLILMVGGTRRGEMIEGAFREAGATVERSLFFPRDYERYDAIVFLSRPFGKQPRRSGWMTDVQLAFDGPIVWCQRWETDRVAFAAGEEKRIWLLQGQMKEHPERLIQMITWLSDTTREKGEPL